MSQMENNPIDGFFDGVEKTALNYVSLVEILKKEATPDALNAMTPEVRANFERSMADLNRETSKMADLLPLIDKAKREAHNIHNK